jgi:hypothetical protein
LSWSFSTGTGAFPPEPGERSLIMTNDRIGL